MQAYLYLLYVGLTSIWLYVYSMCITLHGGPKEWQKRGRAKRVLSHFCRDVKLLLVIFVRSTFKFELFQEIFYLLFRHVYSQSMSDWFSGPIKMRQATRYLWSYIHNYNRIHYKCSYTSPIPQSESTLLFHPVLYT